MQKYHDTVQDINGNGITTASIYVYLAGTGTLAALKKDDETTVLSNPITSEDADNYDSKGNFGFKAVNGIYDIKVVASDTTWKHERVLFDFSDNTTFGGTVTSNGYKRSTTTQTYEAGVLGYTDTNHGFLYRPPQAGAINSHVFQNFVGTDSLRLNDTTLDATFGGNVSLGDNKHIYIGADNDIDMYSTGTQGLFINNTGPMSFYQREHGNDFYFNVEDSVGTNKTCIRAGGATPHVRLYYDGAEVATTASTGINMAAGKYFSVDQGTNDATLMNFNATIDADATSAISSFTTSAATTHHLQFSINGTTFWVAGSTTDPTA